MPDHQKTRDAADGAVDSWLQRVAAVQETTREEPGGDHVRYVLSRREIFFVPQVQLGAVVVGASKRGAYAHKRSLDMLDLGSATGKYMTPMDRTIGRLAAASGTTSLSRLTPAPTLLGMLLQLILETGRLHWETLANPPLQLRALDDARIAWRLDDDGRQRPIVAGLPKAIVLSAKPVWYVNLLNWESGPVDFGMPAELACAVISAPSLTSLQAGRAQATFARTVAPFGSAPPFSESPEAYLEAEPVVQLRVREFEAFPTVELRFAYGGDGPVTQRRYDVERRARQRLKQLGLSHVAWPVTDAESGFHDCYRFAGIAKADLQWARFVHASVPRLRAEGWDVEVEPGVLPEIFEDAQPWDAQIDSSDNRWFDVDLGITIDGERIALLPILISALQETPLDALAPEAPVIGRLADGRLIVLPRERVARLVETLFELFDDEPLGDERRLRLERSQLGVLEELERIAAVQWGGARGLRDLAASLRNIQAAQLAVPPTFHGELRGYQRHGVAWLQVLRAHGLGGVLADDMGLGKTVQLLAHLTIEKAAGRLRAPALIVAPTSVVPNWRSEIARFAPELRPLTLTGDDRATRFASIADADVVFTTYPLLLRDPELAQREWSILVLDEAQAVKNPRSKGAHAVRALRSEQCVVLTGTPIENHLEELWSIFSFATPHLLPERRRFAQLFRTPIEKRGDGARRAALALRIAPFFLRRTKDVVATELPEKNEIVQLIELEGPQRDLYETIRLAMHKRVRDEVQRRGLARSRIVVLDALLKLRQVCCDPRLVKLPAARNVTGSQKLEALFEMLPELIDEGRRVLLFSQFTSMLDLIKVEVVRRNIAFVELRGETKDRTTPVQRFQNGEVPLFLISLKAGGTGLNLTAADTVIHYDPWWNPAVERQATDRAHRIGQHNPVFVYKLIAGGTVEERILTMQARKAQLADALFADASDMSKPLSTEDIDRLFAPF